MKPNSLAATQPHLTTLPVTMTKTAELTVPDRHVRVHPPRQIELIKKSIKRVGFTVPIVTGSDRKVLAGAARLQAARELGHAMVPTISLAHLPEADQRAYILADNKLAELASWDEDVLRIELLELDAQDLDFDLGDLGFSTLDLDIALNGAAGTEEAEAPPPDVAAVAVTRLGDVWQMGRHRLVCGDCLEPETLAVLMRGERARMVFTDPPYNCPIKGHVARRGGDRREFAMAVGEMTSEQFTAFLGLALGNAAAVSVEGSIHYVFMDWRNMAELLTAGRAAIGELKNLCVWAKPNAGMGAFYRSQHELAFVFKKGDAPHLNNFGLGEHGRYRTNVWNYAGASGFHADREEDLGYHPTTKPVAMVADAILDVSAPGDLVLDPFGGSGSTLMAAERTGRCARLIELDPLYCDVICRRFLAGGGDVTLEATGQAFETVATSRAQPLLLEGPANG